MQHAHIRPRQASPLSMDGNDSSFADRYQATLADPRHEAVGRIYGNHRPAGRSHDSSSSGAHSSEGGGLMYSPVMSDSGISLSMRHEDALVEHYQLLSNYLAPHLDRDAVAKSSRARDKLLRLSPTQFHELSTDVYDELLRREDERQMRGADVPPYLLPAKMFHPKRNQARQKLSTLPPERFRQLATDVYYELERRVPRLGATMDRSASPAYSNGGRMPPHRAPNPRGQTPMGYRATPPPQGDFRGPPPPQSDYRGTPPPQADYRGTPPPQNDYRSTPPPQLDYRSPPPPQSDYRGTPPPQNPWSPPPPERPQYPRRTSSNEYGRPMPKNPQSSTIVPNKAIMVEGDDTDDDMSAKSGLEKQSAQSENLQRQLQDMQAKMADLEATMQDKDAEIDRLQSTGQSRDADAATERDDWRAKHADLERKLADSQGRIDAHRDEVERTRRDQLEREADTKDQMDQAMSDLKSQIHSLNAQNTTLRLEGGSRARSPSDQWEQRCESLQGELEKQRRITAEVKENATRFLQEMRVLSQQSEAALEKEEQLQGQITSLEAEVAEWKSRYAKAKTELRTMKASSIGLPMQPMSGEGLSRRQDLMSRDGLVDGVNVTSFQIAIDELLQTARQNGSQATLDKMKVVISHVQQMTAQDKPDYTGLPSPADSPNPMSPDLNGLPPTSATLKARVARNATGLITATRNYVSSDGLSPVSLVDAAAANLTAAVIDYVKTVGIKVSTSDDLARNTMAMAMDDDDDDDYERPTNQPRALDVGKGPTPNGWFSRLKGSFDSAYSNDVAPDMRDDASEYNSYR